MSVPEKNLSSFVRATDVSWLVNISEAGTAINITQDKLYMTIKSSTKLPDFEAEAQAEVTVPSVDPNGLLGSVYFIFTAADLDIPEGNYHYDIKWVRIGSGSGESVVLLRGRIQCLPNVTRSATT